MKKVKKIVISVLKLSLLVGLVLSVGFVNSKQMKMPYKNIEVNINTDNDLYFIDKNDILLLLKNREDSIVGNTKQAVNIPSIEKAINEHKDVAEAEVYATIDGTMKIDIEQRNPIVRVFNTSGESFYIDDKGMLMPLSEKHTVNVLVASGYIYESYALHYTTPVNKKRNDSIKNTYGKSLDKLYTLAKYIQQDTLWSAQIQQVYINKDHDMELYPLVGDQKIIFGDTTDMEEKFQKLYTFYRQGLNTTGWWNKYSTINLKFKNQIVCTKKQNS